MSNPADQELDGPDDADVDAPVFDAPGLDDAAFEEDADEQKRERSGAPHRHTALLVAP